MMTVKTTMTVARAAEMLRLPVDVVDRLIDLRLLRIERRRVGNTVERIVVVERTPDLRIDEIPFDQVPDWASKVCGVNVSADFVLVAARHGGLRARWSTDWVAPIAVTLTALHEWAAGLMPAIVPGTICDTTTSPLAHLLEDRPTQKRQPR